VVKLTPASPPAFVVMNPPAAGLFVGAVWFEGGPGGRIIAFNVVGPNGNFLGFRGKPDKDKDECVPVKCLSAQQLAYCRGWKVDGPDARGRFLADYFLPG
jgi:hypothetical protein